ncbi:anti-sigma-D factor RsdA [Gordonia shandongensis]|uniref:anti-sigma-D factor RsdA n=1 Tax=Gordonia shandongensis TaxID=376351 RepID=UPI0004031084|nr:anti-sigma-D factor RsdA [Gordonia shandongensis]
MSDHRDETDPIDVGAVRRDDAFLDDLAAGRAARIETDAEYELAGLIAAWRADAQSGGVPTTPTADEVVRAIAADDERDRRGGLARRLRIVSGAAAILAVAGAGLLVLSEGSQPGDPLWSVKQVVFSEQAQQTQARMNAEDSLSGAQAAYASGDTVRARELLEKAEADITPLRDEKEAASLRRRIDALRAQHPTTKPTSPTVDSSPTAPSDTDTVDDPDPSDSDSSEPSTPSESSSSSRPSTSKTSPRPTGSTTSLPSSDAPTSSVR